MSVTKTRLILTANGGRTMIIEEDGQQSTISAADLSPSTTYTVSAEIDDSNYGTVVSTNTMSFNTMAAGSVVIKSVSTVWNDSTCTVSAVYASQWPIEEKSAVGYWSKQEDMSEPETLKPSITAYSTTEGEMVFTAKAEPGEYYMTMTLADIYSYVNDKEVYTIK